MKRILATALAVLLIATMAISGSVAYLTSTDNDTNTFTMGDVEIIQHEKDRNGNTFNNEQNLLPGHEFRDGHTPATPTELTGTNCKLWNTESGAIDKIVTVENTGKTKAYVRTIFALEDTGMIATNNQIKLNWNKSAGEANDEIAGRVLINGEYYRLYEYIYTTELAAGATTAPSLLQVAMSAKVGNDVVDAIAASADGHYTILVATQAVQYDNMIGDNGQQMTAEAALDAAFYDVTSEKNPWTMNEVEGSEAENAGTVIYLNSKSDVLNLSGKMYDVNTTFVLENDIDMDNATMYRIGIDYSHSPVVKFVGNGHTISNMKIASMDNDTFGMSNAGLFELRGAEEGNTSLTVENLKLRNVAVTGENKSAGKECTGAAAVVGYMTDNCTVTLNNVDVYDSTINNPNGNASVFVGYTTGKVTLTDCDAYGCKIKGENSDKTGTFVGTANTVNCTVSISNCINNATDLTATSEAQAKDIGRILGDATVTGTGIVPATATSSEGLSIAISAATDNAAYVKLSDATYELPTSVSGKTVTLVGNGKDTKVKANVAVNTGSATLHFENLTIQGGSENYKGFQHANKATYKNCVIDQMVTLYCESEFENCTFNLKDEQYVWTYGAPEVTFKNCTFNTKGKCILVYNEGGNGSVVNIKNCTMNASQKVDGKAAVEIDSQYLTGDNKFIVNINNSKANGFDNGSVSGNSLWNNKKGTKAQVYVNGVAQTMNIPS